MGLRIFILLFGLSSAVAIADPWKTNDQKAYSYFIKNNLDKAEELFKDEYWKATIAYKKGQFKKAITGFKNIKTADGLYNLGNALAFSGDLKQALSAYEQALKLAPKDKDIQFNREIVKKLLKQQQDKQKQEKDKQNKQEQKNEQQDKQQNKQEQKNEQQDKQQNKQQQKNEQQDKQQNKQEQKNEQQDKQQNKQEQKNEQQDKQQNKQEQKNEQQDKERQDQETQQWLKFIEEDPAGLLRQKFLRDYQKVLEGA